MNLESKLELLENVDRDIRNGFYKNLFKYLEYRIGSELSSAQEFAKSSNDRELLSTVLITAVYQDILDWGKNKGSLRADVMAVSEELQSKKRRIKMGVGITRIKKNVFTNKQSFNEGIEVVNGILADSISTTGAISTTGNVSATSVLINSVVNGLSESIILAGALSPVIDLTVVSATSAGMALTLADGLVEGQKKNIICVNIESVDDTAVITVAHLNGAEGTITMDTIGDSIELIFLGTSWFIISNNGSVIA